MDDTSAKENGLSDVELCYKALGVSFSDPPEQIDRVYRKLKDEYGRSIRSSDSAERLDAIENLKQLEDLFATITGSLIYKDYAREYEKIKQIKDAEKKEHREKVRVEKSIVKNCPTCGKSINTVFKTCPYCHKKVYSPTEMLMIRLFSTRNIIIAVLLLLVIAAVGIFVIRPELVGF